MLVGEHKLQAPCTLPKIAAACASRGSLIRRTSKNHKNQRKKQALSLSCLIGATSQPRPCTPALALSVAFGERERRHRAPAMAHTCQVVWASTRACPTRGECSTPTCCQHRTDETWPHSPSAGAHSAADRLVELTRRSRRRSASPAPRRACHSRASPCPG